MTAEVTIPQGQSTVTVELTVKEAMALALGVQFAENRGVAAEAKRKVRETLEAKLFSRASEKIDFDKLHI